MCRAGITVPGCDLCSNSGTGPANHCVSPKASGQAPVIPALFPSSHLDLQLFRRLLYFPLQHLTMGGYRP